MSNAYLLPISKICTPNPFRTHHTSIFPKLPVSQISHLTPIKSNNTYLNTLTPNNSNQQQRNEKHTTVPTMSEIMDASKSQNLDIKLQTLGPFFRITANSLETKNEVGRTEGLVRFWLGGSILHLDSMRLGRETLGMEKSIFGIGLFLGAVAVRHGYDCGCKTAELLAINDSDLYHTKLVKFYTRMGFKTVHEVDGSTTGDTIHMLVWGGKGTRMDASVEGLLMKWGRRFKTRE